MTWRRDKSDTEEDEEGCIRKLRGLSIYIDYNEDEDEVGSGGWGR